MSTIISWTNETWNPTTGCTKISAGCKNCYAEKLSLRFGWSKSEWTKTNEEENIILHPERLAKPLRMKKGSRVFVNSMSDLFHSQIPDDYISRVFDVMNQCKNLTFQILTKRPERAATWRGPWADHIWMGTSIEDKKSLSLRLDPLRSCEAKIKFISFEPLLEDLGELDLTGIDWAIVGGESGATHRGMDHSWARNVRDACLRSGTAFFFKQSAAIRTEIGINLEHEDGSFWKWQQYPGNLTPPIQVG